MVDAQDPCRLVSDLVGLLDLSALTSSLSLQGGVSYHPRLMLKLWMFGLWDGERSSRRIEKRCRTDIRYKWLAGGLVPDHTTLHRFRRKLGPLLDDLLAQSVALGHKAGLGGLGRACIDGTKLPSAASQWRTFREEAEIADQDFEEDASEPSPAVKEKKRIAEPSKDADARTMKARSGSYLVGFNGQCLHDCDSDLVLAVTVSNNASDVDHLVPTLDKCLDLHKELPHELLADTGYDSPANAQALYELGMEGYVGVKGRHMVWTLDEQLRPVCPAGHVADRSDRFMKNDVRVIRLSVDECSGCPFQSKCFKRKPAASKSISCPVDVELVHWVRQRERAQTELGKERLKERGECVEFAFARIKERFRLRRLLLWGLEGARIEFTFAALALNFAVLAAKLGPEKLKELLKRLCLLLMRLHVAIQSLAATPKCFNPAIYPGLLLETPKAT